MNRNSRPVPRPVPSHPTSWPVVNNPPCVTILVPRIEDERPVLRPRPSHVVRSLAGSRPGRWPGGIADREAGQARSPPPSERPSTTTSLVHRAQIVGQTRAGHLGSSSNVHRRRRASTPRPPPRDEHREADGHRPDKARPIEESLRQTGEARRQRRQGENENKRDILLLLLLRGGRLRSNDVGFVREVADDRRTIDEPRSRQTAHQIVGGWAKGGEKEGGVFGETEESYGGRG